MEGETIKTKVCECCKQELPLSMFKKHGRSKDGYSKICVDCSIKNKYPEGNPKLANFTPRELIEELRCRGYHGNLVYIQKHTIVI